MKQNEEDLLLLIIFFSKFAPKRSYHKGTISFLINVCIKEKFTKVLFLSETYWRPIEDQQAWLETDIPNRRPTYLIEDPTETDIPDWRPTYFLRYQHAWSETDMPDQACQMGLQWCMLVSDVAYRSPIRLVSLQWLSDRSLMGLRS